MKREFPPTTPYREKQRVKKDKTGVSLKPSKTARAREGLASFAPARPADLTRPSAARRVSRYREAGAAADELIEILGGDPGRDRGTWAFYCYHHDIGILHDRAHVLASMARQGEIRNPVTAFQDWLQKNYPKEAI